MLFILGFCLALLKVSGGDDRKCVTNGAKIKSTDGGQDMIILR